MWLFLYNLFLPIGFLFFIPGLYWKYRNRPGWKKTFSERFGRFSLDRVVELEAYHGATWIHAVSVGETVVAMGLIKKWQAHDPDRKFVISTTTTTGQELARTQAQTTKNVTVIFCPIDFRRYVRRVFNLIKPSLLVIFETEIWPNLINEAKRRGIPTALVNGRLSDKSSRGYAKFKIFFAPLFRTFSVILAQSEADAKRFKKVAPDANVKVFGNLKFDQPVPSNLTGVDYSIFFGPGKKQIILAASTHPSEEELITKVFIELANKFSSLHLVLVPRHAERGSEIVEMLDKMQVTFYQKSSSKQLTQPVDVLLADTTGEMLQLMNSADIIIMGKSLAGHDEGHNLIEPALLKKPIVTGGVLKNFRFVLDALKEEDALITLNNDDELEDVLHGLLLNPADGIKLGEKAAAAIQKHVGATQKTINELERLK